MALLGRATLLIALALIAYALLAGTISALRARRRLALSAENALSAAFAAVLFAFVLLGIAFLRNDVSLANGADHARRELPSQYKLSAIWGGQEGSLLLWLTILLAYAAVAVRRGRRLAPDLVAWVVPVLAAIAGFFALVLVAVSSPFATQTATSDGAGLNPLLQNPYMLSHPPLLYLGYVGLAVPFAFCMAALLAGQRDERWLIATRRWTLVAWTALGVGQLVGAHWAYTDVGWGGYFAWDPVENAALMPWVAATAFLHSVMIQEKRGMLKVWNVTLVSLAFTLSLFGTFLTRSGVLSSIHSFAQSPLGSWFLGFIVLVVAFAAALMLFRARLLRAETRLESLLSREATFLYNNLLLVAFCLTVLWGVCYPLLSELVTGTQRHVGPSYYNFFLKVFGLPLLLLMGIGPLVAWRRASLRSLRSAFAWPALFALGTGLVLLALGAGSSVPGLIAYTFAAFVLASIVYEFARGTAARRSVAGEPVLRAFSSLIGRNRRRYGGYVVHAAICLIAIGIVGSSIYGSSAFKQLRPGQSLALDGRRFVYQGLQEKRVANMVQLRARVAIFEGGRKVGVAYPGKNRYIVEQQVSNRMAIVRDWLRAQDTNLVAQQIDANGTLYLEVLVKPLVNFIWLAGGVFLLGSLIALWPDEREQRRLASRYARLPALARA
ncbi:MAG: heme lyase CcmF/NrfE family subunit [Gaiellaceae bacterium]